VSRERGSAWVKDPKWDPRGIPGMFIGITCDGHALSNGASIKGWAVWTLETADCVIVSHDVAFDEQVFPCLLGPMEWQLSEARGGKTTLKPSTLHQGSQGLDVLPFEVTAEEINSCAEKLTRTSIVGNEVYKRDEDSDREGAQLGKITAYNNDETWTVEFEENCQKNVEVVDIHELFNSKKYVFARVRTKVEDHDIFATYRVIVSEQGGPYMPD
jgi:hypothetical protein